MSRFEELSTFVAIARAGSISRAAEQKRLAKSAISRRLADLEARLGVQLIARTTRQMSLTDAGEAFLKRAEDILDALGEAEAAVRSDQQALTGKLKIAAPLSYGLAQLKPFLADFVRSNPGLDLDIDFSDRQVNLVEEGVDVAVRIGRLSDSRLIARKLGPVRHIAAASPSFWQANGHPDHPSDLQSLDCLRYRGRDPSAVLRYWGPGGEVGRIQPPIRVFASNGDFVASLAADGCGFVVEPDFILQPYFDAGQLEPVLVDYAWSDMAIYLVYPPTRRVSARTRAFSDAVIAHYSDRSSDVLR